MFVKSLKNQCNEKGIDEPDTLSFVRIFDNNLDIITKHYLENNRKSNAALAVAAEQRKRLRQQLIMDGTEFLMAKYRFTTIEKVMIFYFMIEKKECMIMVAK